MGNVALLHHHVLASRRAFAFMRRALALAINGVALAAQSNAGAALCAALADAAVAAGVSQRTVGGTLAEAVTVVPSAAAAALFLAASTSTGAGNESVQPVTFRTLFLNYARGLLVRQRVHL